MSQRACEELRQLLPDHVRGRLALQDLRELELHLGSCPACSAVLQEERVLSELLQTRLSAEPAPERLKRALTKQVARALAETARAGASALPLTAARATDQTLTAASSGQPTRPARVATRRARNALLVGLSGLSLAAALMLGVSLRPRDTRSPLLREAVNDHLRVLYAQNPVEIPNGGLHQVKPWFLGRVDFAPDITFVGDDEFPMVGGAVSYFVNRKAASFVFKRRLHTISLFVFRSEALDWPRGEMRELGPVRVQQDTLDGFHVVFWQAQGLGHALVSDVSQPELLHLAAKLQP